MANIILDFDGTLADSFALVIEIFRQLTGNHDEITEAHIDRLRHLPAIRVASELGISVLRVPYLMAKGRRIMGKRLHLVSLFAGMPEVIQVLHREGHKLFIMSSNSTVNVTRVLKANKLESYFVKVYGGVGLTGKSRVLKRLMRHYKLSPTDCIYIGDETRDIEASKRVGVNCLAVTWGFNDPELLKLHGPSALVSSPEDIPAAIMRVLAAGRL